MSTKGPKRPMTAFFYFLQENRNRIKHEGEKLKPTELTSKAGEEWRGMNDEQRAKYNELAKIDKNRFDQEKKMRENMPIRRKKEGNEEKKKEGKEEKKKEEKEEENGASEQDE